jgi:hypothetical protein
LNSDLRVLACLDRALDVYGKSVKQVVYWNLETMFGVKKESIPNNPGEFVETLDKIFGSGATIVKKTILIHMEELRRGGRTGSFDELLTALKDARIQSQNLL